MKEKKKATECEGAAAHKMAPVRKKRMAKFVHKKRRSNPASKRIAKTLSEIKSRDKCAAAKKAPAKKAPAKKAPASAVALPEAISAADGDGVAKKPVTRSIPNAYEAPAHSIPIKTMHISLAETKVKAREENVVEKEQAIAKMHLEIAAKEEALAKREKELAQREEAAKKEQQRLLSCLEDAQKAKDATDLQRRESKSGSKERASKDVVMRAALQKSSHGVQKKGGSSSGGAEKKKAGNSSGGAKKKKKKGGSSSGGAKEQEESAIEWMELNSDDDVEEGFCKMYVLAQPNSRDYIMMYACEKGCTECSQWYGQQCKKYAVLQHDAYDEKNNSSKMSRKAFDEMVKSARVTFDHQGVQKSVPIVVMNGAPATKAQIREDLMKRRDL